jgi:phage FluMu gp28-like protein
MSHHPDECIFQSFGTENTAKFVETTHSLIEYRCNPLDAEGAYIWRSF